MLLVIFILLLINTVQTFHIKIDKQSIEIPMLIRTIQKQCNIESFHFIMPLQNQTTHNTNDLFQEIHKKIHTASLSIDYGSKYTFRDRYKIKSLIESQSTKLLVFFIENNIKLLEIYPSIHRTCFIFTYPQYNLNIFKSVLSWSQHFEIHNPLFVFMDSNQKLRTFTYNLYDNYKLSEITDRKYYQRTDLDFRNGPVNIDIEVAVPQIIRSKSANSEFTGRDGKLINMIIAKSSLKACYITQDYLFRLTIYGAPDQSVDLSARSTFLTSGWGYLYPMLMERLCFIVPAAEPYPQYLTYFMTINRQVFFIYLLTLLTAFIILSMSKRDIISGKTLTHLLQITFNASCNQMDYRKLNVKELFVWLPWTMGGLVLTNTFISILASFITEPNYQPEINSFEDIQKSGLKIAIALDEQMSVIDINLFNSILLPMQKEFFEKLIFEDGNTSYCYITLCSKANLVMERQKRSDKRKYHMIDDNMQQFLMSFKIPKLSKFANRFNEIMLWVYSSGLYYKWMSEAYDDYINSKTIPKPKLKEKEHQEITLDLTDLQLCWAIVNVGYTVSIILFGIELLVNSLWRPRLD